MIAKADPAPESPAARKKRRSAKEAVDVELTLRFNFGEAPADHVTVMDAQRIPMVGGVLANRDRILRGFVRMMLRTAVKQPRVARELFPWIKRKKRRGKVARNSK